MATLLIIDTQPLSRVMLRDLLDEEYNVLEASNADAALALSREHRVDLIFLDMDRPDYDAPEICAQLKDDPVAKYIPLILLSDHSQKENIINGLHAGAEDYMTKPVHACELFAKIDAHLRTRSYYTDLEKADLLMLLELTEMISVTRNPQKILPIIVEKMIQAIDVSRCSIISLNEEGDLVVKASNDLPTDREIKLKIENYPEIQRALTTQRPLLLQEVHNHPLMAPVHEKIKSLADNSLIVVPIIKKQNVIGTFFLRTASPLKVGLSTRVFKLCQVVANIAGSALENAVLFEDMQSSRKLLEDMASRDSLTGLYNHQQFHTRFEEEFSRAQRYGQSLSCIFADIDNFKRVNDRFGHVIGDMVLRKIGQLLPAMFRKSDFPARYGGEEFAVFLPNTTGPGAEEFGDRLRTMISEMTIPQLQGERITLSVGIASYPTQRVKSYEDLIKLADQAMYTEKTRKKVSENPVLGKVAFEKTVNDKLYSTQDNK